MEIFHGQYYGKHNIFWKGICLKNRNVSISKLEDVIDDYGYIDDFREFSDISISFIISIRKLKLAALLEKLKSIISIEEQIESDAPQDDEITVFLHVTFSEAKGKLKIDVPSVPG